MGQRPVKRSERSGLSGMAATVITCSDSVSRNRATDRSGPAAVSALESVGLHARLMVVPDERSEISGAISEAVTGGSRVVVTTGGTGLGPRDVTPEALMDVCERTIPGIGEALRAAARKRVPMTDLSRAVAGLCDRSLVVALPGSTGGVRDGMDTLLPLLPHALEMLDGGGHRHNHGSSGAVEPPAARESGTGPDATTADDEAASLRDVEARVVIAEVQQSPVDSVVLSEAVSDASAGAVVTFEGRVRDHDHGRQVTELFYEAHPDAARLMRHVLVEGAAQPGVLKVAAIHRVGALEIGEVAVVVSASAAHRADAFRAASWLIDEIKARIPVWKRQTYADDTHEWVNCA